MPTKRAREISKLLAIRDREGLTYAELGARTGLSPTTLSWWAWRLRREGRRANSFLEVEVAESADPLNTAETDSGVSVEVGDEIRVHVAVDFDAGTLRRVVTTLATRC